ncbi:unnamed protein product [Lepeophtheirus salmonis]|uniref:(salmon louse) hypothetical protein n=1 Tax=Lepeophtheirus salmonis TaxID=72036 RepID=A0A7R8CLJ2_LEPSM|nr:unnamed protein product [Lepeophtheirus salmonis]CAF2859217.1 unnamed protein product [Lepeophtheirus salmonis]
MVCGLNNTECYSDKVRCDGVVDCSDFADELQCSGCETFLNMGYLGIREKINFICDDQYYCADSDICIPSIHRCDLKRHCPDGSDEKDCVSLWPEPVDPEYSNVLSPHANESDLIRREFHFGDVPNDAVYVNLDCGTMECGARSYSYKPEMADIGDFFKQRIVGGSESVPFDWPSIAAVYIDGILLLRQVQEIIHHGNFNGTYLTHDVALLYFEEPILFNAKVNLVCLNDAPVLPSVGEHCITVGWGSTHESENNVNNEMLQVERICKYIPILRNVKMASFTCKFIQECLPMDIKCDFKKDCMDGSDETNCLCVDYLRKNGSQICDGISDCPDSSDELNCETCGSDEFFCDLSSKCIPKKKVCDKIIDCKFKEDERHCITLVPYTQQEGIKVLYSEERPIKFNHGYIALNYKGVWSPLLDFNYVKANELKDSDFLSSPLRVEREDGSQIEALDEPSEFSMCETGVIQSSCSETTRCGVHPNALFPWQVTLYQEGQYMCGASLIHRNWIMTSKECSSKMKPSRNYVVARMGGFRNGRFLSPHEQVRQVIQFTRVPHTGISLGTFRNAVDLGKYVNPVCIPSTNWFPFRGQCIISGIDHRAGILNRGVKMSVEEICEINTSYDYSVCTELVDKDEDVCMDNWSGTLSCLDHSNRYYVLGVYHTSNGGCENPGTGGKRNAFPTKFRSVSTATARDAIRKIMTTVRHIDVLWESALKSSEICDGIPHCGDMSDEREYICGDRPIVRLNDASLCLPINSTHCGCKKDQFMCKRTRLCLERNAFCDGVDDCGDSSDEPSGCGDCVTALRTLKPESICDGNIDCIIKGSDSIGSDESSKQCCNLKNSTQPFRCVSGNISVCDHCKGHAPGDCRNGADDEDCLSISRSRLFLYRRCVRKTRVAPTRIPALYCVRKEVLVLCWTTLLWCAGKDSDLRMKAAEILCRNEGYYYSGQLTFHQTVEKHYVFFL